MQVGPVSNESAEVWLAYAREVVAAVARQLPIQVAAGFSGYLEEWSDAAAASAGGMFVWEGQSEPEEVEYLLHAFFKLAQTVAEQPTVHPMPAEGQLFYTTLVTALLNALRSENRATSEFAEHRAPFWPGLNSQPA